MHTASPYPLRHIRMSLGPATLSQIHNPYMLDLLSCPVSDSICVSLFCLSKFIIGHLVNLTTLSAPVMRGWGHSAVAQMTQMVPKMPLETWERHCKAGRGWDEVQKVTGKRNNVHRIGGKWSWEGEVKDPEGFHLHMKAAETGSLSCITETMNSCWWHFSRFHLISTWAVYWWK